MSEVSFFVGIDLGNEKHAVCVLDQSRAPVKSRVVENDYRLVEFIIEATGATPAQVHIALEDRNNVVVDALLLHGFSVFTANPKQVDRFRDRETVAGAKDDRRDASVLANALATDRRCFAPVALQSEAEGQLKALTATTAELDEDHRRLANRLRAVLLRFFPALLSLCEGADQAWFWALLTRLGDAEAARRVRASTIAALLKSHRRRAVTVDDVVAAIAIKHLATGAGVKEAGRQHAASLIACLVVVEKQRTATTRARDALLAKLAEPVDAKVSDVTILLSMPGVGLKSAAVIYSECRSLLVDGKLERLRAIVGVAPVTKQSGKQKNVTMRYACNERLRHTLFHVANTAVRHDGRFKAKYEALIARGHHHARALRGVADLQLHVLVAMMKTRTTYEAKPVPAAS